MIFDPIYLLFVMAPALILSGLASWRVRANFKKYSRVRAMSGMTGAQAAKVLLDRAGIHDVRIVRARGHLSDHYNPMNKTLALSDGVHDSTSVAAIGIACHEAGHAIQHATKYAPLWLRSLLVPTANIGSSLGYIVIFAGLILNLFEVAMLGVVMFSAVLLFQLVTLPVEFDASARAKRLATEYGIVLEREQEGMNKVLNAAAMTYVAAVVATLLTLAYFLLRVLAMRR